MSRKLDIKKGDTVFIKVIEGSNASRNITPMTEENINRWLFKGEVLSIGRKYISVKFETGKEEKFKIDSDYRNKYTYGGFDYKLYVSRQEILDEKESERLYGDIKRDFSDWNNNNKFTLDQLRRISKIINE